MSWISCTVKLDELAKMYCKFDELAKLRMSSISWVSWNVSLMAKLRMSSRWLS